MDEELREKCENLMNVVVETRKRFGKKCVEYDQKTLLIENKIINLQLEYLSKAKFKPKYQNLDTNIKIREIDNYINDVQDREKRINELFKKLKSTEEIVLQLKEDKISLKIIQPLSVETKLKIIK